ncbi:ester cyclase [Roseomonas eburnea]|uniref:Ester cyclase n=1 Tax=Neoroseomonas eburnea TaxID=1346889 RepID=A0A9X9X5Q0_9PROT|nr:ester cyclase [Neoroseomonas eburnea]
MSERAASNAEVVRAFYAELWEKADLARLPALMHDDVAFQGTFGQTMHGHDAFAAYVRSVRHAFSTYRCEVVDLLCDGERVAARVRFSGRHDAGSFLDFAPTGRDLAWEGVGFFTLGAGRIRHLWVMGDMLGLLGQLRT